MGMTQRIHFWHQNLLKITIFGENGKQSLFWSKRSKKIQTACKALFELKMLKLHENHLETNV